MAQEQHLFPFVCRTIRTPIAHAFVAVARAGKSGTRNIKQNAADRTFLLHAFLIGWGIEGSLILPIPTRIAKKADIFCRWREILACNDNACGESKSQNFPDSLLDLTFLIASTDPKAPIY